MNHSPLQSPSGYSNTARCGMENFRSFILQSSFLPVCSEGRGGWVMRWCWLNFQCRGVLLIWIVVGQGPAALAVGTHLVGVVRTFFSCLLFLFSFSLSLGDGPI